MAGLGDMVNKAKEWAGKNPEKADGFVDKGTDAVKGKFQGHDEQIDGLAQKGKDYLHGPGEGQAPPPPPPPQ